MQLIYAGKQLTNESSSKVFTWEGVNKIAQEVMKCAFGGNTEELEKILTSDEKKYILSNALSRYGGTGEILLWLPYTMTFRHIDVSRRYAALKLLLTHLDDIDVNALSKRFNPAMNILEYHLYGLYDNFEIIELLVSKGAIIRLEIDILGGIFSSEYSKVEPGYSDEKRKQ